jgi:hypothetical protein
MVSYILLIIVRGSYTCANNFEQNAHLTKDNKYIFQLSKSDYTRSLIMIGGEFKLMFASQQVFSQHRMGYCSMVDPRSTVVYFSIVVI